MSSRIALLVALLLVLLAPTGARAQAQDALPGKPYRVCARFPTTTPAAVVVDVQDVAVGTQIGNNVAATRGTLDSANADYWCVDLDTVSGFAPDCDPKAYAVRFVPDAANCAAGQSPQLCPELTVASGGAACWASGTDQTVVYTATPIPSRGITQAVINRGNPSYIRHEVKIDDGVTDFTFYQVYYYDTAGRVDHTTRTLVVPNP